MPPSKSRADWDHYFLDLARQTATRSSCTEEKYGAVIVSNRRINSTGYNGTPTGYGHCDEGACPRGQKHDAAKLCLGLHAEANAILYAAPNDREGATLYVTSAPCMECAKLIANSGLREVVTAGDPADLSEKVKKFLLDCRVRIRILKT